MCFLFVKNNGSNIPLAMFLLFWQLFLVTSSRGFRIIKRLLFKTKEFNFEFADFENIDQAVKGLVEFLQKREITWDAYINKKLIISAK